MRFGMSLTTSLPFAGASLHSMTATCEILQSRAEWTNGTSTKADDLPIG
jgi:hypothetical protein